MSDEQGEDGGRGPGGLLKGRAAWLLGGAGFTGLALLTLWTQRAPLAENFIGHELDALGVRARYELTSVGLRTQRIEHIVLGDPAHPDLTADWAEVDLTLSGLSPGVAAIRAGGVRLYGRYHDGVLSLGELDRFRQPSAPGEPFSLPDMVLALSDARMRLDTDMGAVGLTLDGAGNLRSGFSGKLAAVMPKGKAGGCAIAGGSAWLDVAIRAGAPRISGPVRATALDCADAGLTLAKPAVNATLALGPALDRWKGRAALSGEALRFADATVASPSGDVRFEGTQKGTKGLFDLKSGALHAAGVSAAQAGGRGAWSIADGKQGLVAQVRGAISARGVRPVSGDDPLAAIRTQAGGTPIGPLAARFADAVRDAIRNNAVDASFALSRRGDRTALALSDARLSSDSGARIAFGREGGHAAFVWPEGNLSLAGGLTMEGGGFPKAALRIDRGAKGGWGGQLFVDDYASGDARLALAPLRFVPGRDGTTRFSTTLRLDGPLAAGRLDGLDVPLSGSVGRNGQVALNPGCTPLTVARLTYSDIAIGKSRITVCAAGKGALLAYGPQGLSGGGAIEKPRLEGRMGEGVFGFSADAVRFALGRPGLDIVNADLAMGDREEPVRLTAATLSGTATGKGFGGRIDGATARIGPVPIDVGKAAGQWTFANGALKLDGGLTLTDRAVPDRFNPLESRDFALTLRDGRIVAKGTLVEPGSGAEILDADIAHDLGTGKGKVDFTVPGITFSPALQPEAITRLVLGVVANARGTVTGKGAVRWDGDKVTSDGSFRTDSMDLAAAFGPVTGLKGEIRFTDLINLVSAPHQEAHLATVNPGVEVRDGVVRYQLQAGQKVHIEGGGWPFSGGNLVLLPTTMDFSADTDRYMTFRVIGLDAGAFINTMELNNVSATGTFDGILPLVFNAEGGRILGGVLVARQQGMPPLLMPEGVLPTIPCDPTRQAGTLSYVGPVSNEQVGVMGKIAFDALKDLQYKCLTILMDGALDGELVTNVVFNGVNRGKLGDVPESMARNFIGLPFLFNIRIQAPFRGLLSTAQSVGDPNAAIRNSLGDDYQEKIRQGIAVQPAESETVPSGEKK